MFQDNPVKTCLQFVHNEVNNFTNQGRPHHVHDPHHYLMKDVHMAGQNAMHLAAQHSQDCLAVLLFGPLRFSNFSLLSQHEKYVLRIVPC